MKHNYDERKQNRIDYALDQASKHQRNDGDEIHNIMNNSAAHRKADYYNDKARAIEDNKAISSDDPDAIEKLEAKLKSLIKTQEFMKAANKCLKKKDKDGFLQLEGATEGMWIKINTPDRANRVGFPSFELTNNNANIRRLKERLETLKTISNKTTEEKLIKGVRVIENVEANRVQLIFPGTPSDEVRRKLKKEFAFIWCKSEGAWQRFLNNSGLWAAEKFLETYEQENASTETSRRAA